MIVEVKYGRDGSMKAEIPESNYIGTYYPNDVVCGDAATEIGKSLDAPIESEPLEKFLEGE